MKPHNFSAIIIDNFLHVGHSSSANFKMIWVRDKSQLDWCFLDDGIQQYIQEGFKPTGIYFSHQSQASSIRWRNYLL